MQPPFDIEALSALRAALRQPLPGLAAQLQMSPNPRPGAERILEPGLDCRHAAVLVLLYPGDDDRLCVVLTRRTDHVETHRGQISFPGGSLDRGETAAAAALREAQEELEVQPGELEILGSLSPLYIPHTEFCVHPLVACATTRPAFTPNPYEVAEVIEAPLWRLMAPATRCEEVWELRGAPVTVPYYAIGEHKVWGATAMMLSELLTILQTEAYP